MEAILASIQVLPWGSEEAAAYGLLRAHLEQSGISLGSMDMMIVAHASATRAILVTKDKAFDNVDAPYLFATANWASDL